jgi:hypothetical protein
MQASVVTLLLVASSLSQINTPIRVIRYGEMRKEELEGQQKAFKQWWGDDLVLRLDDLPTEGKVPHFRVPYAGHDYPDMAGGTLTAMYKYDQAFYRGRSLAAEFERMDVRAHRDSGHEEIVFRGPFGRIRTIRGGRGTPTWYGHCNGWTAAAIRHAEPQRSVVRNGVVFTPADIKGLLAEVYMYTESEFLGGLDTAINPGILHLTLTNWLGRGSHPIGMETAVGEVVINFPIFSYRSVIRKLSSREAEVRTSIAYTVNIPREMDKGPQNYHRQMYFHYILELNDDAEIRGGRYMADSQQIDMLWTPLKPAQGGDERNPRGNPHLNVKEVLAIWRESVPDELRKQWLNIDPTEEDRVLPPSETLASTTDQPASPAETTATADTATGSSPVASSAATAAAESAAGSESLVAAGASSTDGSQNERSSDGARSDGRTTP